MITTAYAQETLNKSVHKTQAFKWKEPCSNYNTVYISSSKEKKFICLQTTFFQEYDLDAELSSPSLLLLEKMYSACGS